MSTGTTSAIATAAVAQGAADDRPLANPSTAAACPPSPLRMALVRGTTTSTSPSVSRGTSCWPKTYARNATREAPVLPEPGGQLKQRSLFLSRPETMRNQGSRDLIIQIARESCQSANGLLKPEPAQRALRRGPDRLPLPHDETALRDLGVHFQARHGTP